MAGLTTGRFAGQCPAASAEPISEDAGIVLTDDFNPVEFHDARNRERFRRLLASSVLEL